MSETLRNPIGLSITGYTVMGKEVDRQQRWVGAELAVNVAPIGQFALEVVTKEHFIKQMMLEATDSTDLNSTEGLEKLLDAFPGSQIVNVTPFLLNDEVITDEVLDQKFKNRIVQKDLAASLAFIPES